MTDILFTIGLAHSNKRKWEVTPTSVSGRSPCKRDRRKPSLQTRFPLALARPFSTLALQSSKIITSVSRQLCYMKSKRLSNWIQTPKRYIYAHSQRGCVYENPPGLCYQEAVRSLNRQAYINEDARNLTLHC